MQLILNSLSSCVSNEFTPKASFKNISKSKQDIGSGHTDSFLITLEERNVEGLTPGVAAVSMLRLCTRHGI